MVKNRFFGLLFAFVALISAIVWPVLLIYIAVHFLAKYW